MNSDYLVENLEAYANTEMSTDAINRLVKNFQYRNSVRLYKYTNSSWLYNISRYRTKAIDCYQQIAKLLNKPIVHKSFEVKDHISQLFVGAWKNIGDAKIPIRY